MRVVVERAQDDKVTVRVMDGTGSAMAAGDGKQVPDDGVWVAQGQTLALEISDHEGFEPDLDSFAIEGGS